MKIGKLSVNSDLVKITVRTFENIDGVTLSVILNIKQVSYPFVLFICE